MDTETPVWKDDYASAADALGVDISTVKRFVKIGRYRSVKFGGKRPVVRLEPPSEFLAREGKWTGAPSPAAAAMPPS